MPHLRLGAALTAATTGILLTCAVPAQAEQEASRLPARYAEQTLDWHRCGTQELPDPPPQAAHLLRCATFVAPRDWAHPGGGHDVTVAVSKLPATGTGRRALVVNPGGPGAPGRTFPLRLRHQDRVRSSHDVIGFDPRGTGASSTVSCGGATSDLDPLDPRDRDAANLDRILDTTEDAVRTCHRRSGPLGPFVTTYQTVRDIDLLRHLLGRPKISWLGYSAGTWLGAHYATAFPSHVERMVLDSAVEFTTDWQRAFEWQPMGFERRWRADFLPWIARYHELYGFGRTATRARLSYERVRAALQDEPVTVDGARVGPNELDLTIAGALYSKRHFERLAEHLAAVRTAVDHRRGTQARSAADELAPVLDSVPPGPRPLVVPIRADDSYQASFWTIPCNETAWRGDRASAIAQSEFLGRRYPLLGWGWLVQPCLSWRTPPITLPTPTGHGVPPTLIVQSTHDPATPIEGAWRAHGRFAGSMLLTVLDEGDHGLYAGDNGCVDAVVEDYLLDGATPDRRTCPGAGLPVPEAAR